MQKRIDESIVHKEHYDEIRNILENEPYAQFLGMKLTEFGPGTATAVLVPTDNMLNSHNTVHGAVLFSLADYVFAVASNSFGKTAVGVTTTMNFMSSGFPGETIMAVAREEKRNHRLAWYNIEIRNEKELLATMQGMVYRKNEYFISIE
ncbi:MULTISPECIES: hotdog fold thioesterase [Paenisporosarcina]|uniref:Hotdog fold thioesterase n=1 Tax=Paenisporosarcina antarctica TaxID=417367 RepID=A0A4P6ZZX6_9BACL|nr:MULTISPECIES: hotdog fold thioesterase [Paenisporosarcina]QBP41126.1 hotdog fold thioesterase [Paenisporosarcina antarctica]